MSVPGTFGMNYQLLKWAYATDPDPIKALFNGCLDLGYHPTVLHNTVISIIPKPRKTNMVDPKSYWPISLLEMLSKLLEKIITKWLIFEAGKHNLLPHTQFGGCDMTSCTDAGLCLVNNIHAYWNHKEHVSLLTMDISGYFNNIDHTQLIYTCQHLGYLDNICNWLKSYLSNHTAQPQVDDVMCTPIALPSVSVPQGSPLSPILSSIYSIPLLQCLQDDCLSTCAYIDDFSILVHLPSVSYNIEILNEADSMAINTLTLLGLDFDMEKSDLIHFISPKQEPHSFNLNITHPNGKRYEIQHRHSIHWLGFYLDHYLNFKDHV
ncbi:hypothetical protein OPQ81_004911 [Rhizoctonia solani]|nr:hypothetical protein OPQ81_004911 [Rhizoctonia solani]